MVKCRPFFLHREFSSAVAVYIALDANAKSCIKQGFRAVPRPHLGQSDHISPFMLPAYTPSGKETPPLFLKQWTLVLKGPPNNCFELTDWRIFQSPDLKEYTTSVLSYIKHCTDTITTEKHIWVYANQRPWMTTEVRTLLKGRNAAYRSGDAEVYTAARADLKRGIRRAKLDYKNKIEDYLHSNNSRQVWRL